MTAIEVINGVVVLIGVPTIAAVLLNTGRKLEKLDTIEDDLKTNIKPDLKEVRERFGALEGRVDTLWKDRFAPSHSPRQLNDKGSKILEESGIKSIVDEKKSILLQIIKKKNPTNPYDAEIIIGDVMEKLPEHCPEVVDDLKLGAFKVGADIQTLLFVGSIYLRNQIFPDLGFDLNDLDKPRNS